MLQKQNKSGAQRSLREYPKISLDQNLTHPVNPLVITVTIIFKNISVHKKICGIAGSVHVQAHSGK